MTALTLFKLFGIKKRTSCEPTKEDAAVDANDRCSISSTIMIENIENCNSTQELGVKIETSHKHNLLHHVAAKESIRTLSNKKRHVQSIDNKNNDDACNKKMIISLCSASLPNLKKWSHDVIPPPFRSKAFIAPPRYQGLYIPDGKKTLAHWEIIIHFDWER